MSFLGVVNLNLLSQFCKSKQKQFHIRKPKKTRELSSKLLYCFGNFEKKKDLSRIHLAVL